MKDLFEKIEYGTAGVAIHTKQNGKGELWGVHKEEEEGRDGKEAGARNGTRVLTGGPHQ